MIPRPITLALIALLSAELACSNNTNQSPPMVQPPSQPQALTEDDYAVYSALLDSEASKETDKPQKAVAVADLTAALHDDCSPETDSSSSLSAAILDMKQRNVKRLTLKADQFHLKRGVELLSSVKLDSVFSNGPSGWSVFEKTFPPHRSYLDVSAVGFSPDHKIAVVYSASHCGSLCGAGGVAVFVKQDGHWRSKSSQLCWIS